MLQPLTLFYTLQSQKTIYNHQLLYYIVQWNLSLSLLSQSTIVL